MDTEAVQRNVSAYGSRAYRLELSMFAIIAVFIAVVAWAVHVLGDGLNDPWAWAFAVLAFIAAELVTRTTWPPRWRP